MAVGERTLVVGFGNVYRRDDGVGFAVVNAVRRGLGLPPLEAGDDGMEDIPSAESPLDGIVLHQLIPELAELFGAYARVIFVDAHVAGLGEKLLEEPLEACYKPATVSHTLHPCTLLALAAALHGHAPAGVLISVCGHDFDFGEGLSPETERLLPHAVERVLALAGLEGGAHA